LMTRAWLFGITAVAAVQLHALLRRPSDLSYGMRFYWLPLLALGWYFAGLAVASIGIQSPRAIRLMCLLGVSVVALFTSPSLPVLEPQHLLFPSLGTAALVAALLWLSRALWRAWRLAGILVGTGGVLGALAFLRLIVQGFIATQQSELDFGAMLGSTDEFIYLSGLGGSLACLAAFARWVSNRAPGSRRHGAA